MLTGKLRRIRIVVSLIFFVLTSLLFLEISGYFVTVFSDYILFLQFLPSFLSFVHIISLGTIGFLVISSITILFGRVYCSSVCPLGLQNQPGIVR